MKKTNKFLSILLAVCTVFTMLSISTSAVQTEIIGGSSMNTAKNVPSFGISYVSTLDKNRLEDWFKFTAPVTGEYSYFLKNYNIEPTGGNRLWSDFYDKYYQRLGGQGYLGPGDGYTIKINLEANVTYYFRVYSDYSGNYEFIITAPANAKTLKSISVTKPNKTEYSIGESFNSSGMVVKATYSDGSNETLSSGSYTVSGFNSSSAGKKTITVSYTYGGVTKTATFSVTVKNSQGGGESGGGTSGGSTIINNIVNVINNIFVTIKSPFEQLINAIVKLFNTIFK